MTAGAVRLAEPRGIAGTAAAPDAPPAGSREVARVVPLPRAAGRSGQAAGLAAVPAGQVPAAARVKVNNGRPAPRPGPLVLTRRGRVVVTGFLAVIAAGLIMVLPRGADATGAGVSPAPDEQKLAEVALRPGDTLWSIAVRTDPRADPRLVVQRITDLNALAGAGITPGRMLWVPKD
jgi:hypothetical protein